MSQGSISAFFPAYNDWGTIASQVVLIARVLRRAHGRLGDHRRQRRSPDHCADVLEELVKLIPNLRVVTHETNRGYGGALRSGFAAARKEWIFYTDGDAQYDVTELPLLWAGPPRRRPGERLQDLASDPLHRIVVGRLYHWLVKWAFRLEALDVDCDFRLIHRRVFDAIELTRDTGLICVELVTKIEKYGFAARYVPVHHYHRLHGRSQFFNFRRVAEVALGMGRLVVGVIVRKQIRR